MNMNTNRTSFGLGDRMKKFYEEVPKTRLMKKEPVVIRCDGRAFHTFTKHFKKPFDEIFIKAMQETTKYMCENIPGCVLGYVESDEISLIITDYEDFDTSAWYDYEVQKLTSVTASMATMAFNKAFYKYANEWLDNFYESWNITEKEKELAAAYRKAIESGGMFDSRVFNLPKEEVTNYVFWRQQDASRNSVQMLGHAYFSQTEMHGKNNSEIQDMLMLQKGINWNNLPTEQKRGACVVKEEYGANEYGKETRDTGYLPNMNEFATDVCLKSRWVVDREIPIFKGEDREYVESRVYFGIFAREKEAEEIEYEREE